MVALIGLDSGARQPVWPGHPEPLGATWDGRGVNFALFSAHAEKVELCLFDNRGQREIERIVLPEYTNEVWHGYLPEATPDILYGYRVYGPYDPHHGHRFNHHKLLIDPYARALHGSYVWSDANYGYRIGSQRADLSFDRRDNARGVPKCRVVENAFSWGGDRAVETSWEETVIYEMHLRGFTMGHPGVPPLLRGTCAGLSIPAAIAHLTDLGVTAVELMPVHARIDEQHLVEAGLSNFWGYNTIGFFAPDPRYLATGRLGEFKTMVSRLHDSGIEVFLDVVYNHTAEGNHLGPTMCFRGIDNASYYRLSPDNPRHYVNDSGCGNTLNLASRRVVQMVMDSLRYWHEEMHVDGFRFDLATVLAREASGFDTGAGFLDAVAQDPSLRGVKMIAEPWDLGPGGYQLGSFPPGWVEWNDKYRDVVRAYWQGSGGLIGELAWRLTGSSDLFERGGRRPWASINYITAHDGFTLTDLVSYDTKHNEDNGENNRDGNDNNHSWNCGIEGPTDDLSVLRLRMQQKRNLIATLLLSQGVPMLLSGDELGHSQLGNNNVYCQDNELAWVDWRPLPAEDQAFLEFVKLLIRLRREHPVFRRPRFFHGRFQSAGATVKDITWLTADGAEMSDEEWHQSFARVLGLHLGGDTGHFINRSGHSEMDRRFILLLNAHHDKVPFTLPPERLGRTWEVLFDTAREGVIGFEAQLEAPNALVKTRFTACEVYPLQARSLVLLIQVTQAGHGGGQ